MKQITFLTLALIATLAAADSRQWIREHAVPLKSAQAGQGFDDMQPLKKMVGDARIVSLGEATHGTREFFQLKHRMLEFLATEMGFTLFSIEANMPEAYRLNEYVLTGKGDPAALLKGLYFWTWDTEEVLAMIRWMREFNASGKGRVEFTGFDMQTPDVAMQNARSFVAKHDSGYGATLEAATAMVGSRGHGQQSFGVITVSLPAAEWAGKKVRFTGAIRTEDVVQGGASLWLRADAGGQVKAFRNLGGTGTAGTTAWKTHTVELLVPQDADQIHFGGTLAGVGKAWFDELALEVDGKPVGLANPGFEGALRSGYHAGGADTRVEVDTEIFQGGKQSLRLERNAARTGSEPNGSEPDVRTAIARWAEVAKHLEEQRPAYREKGAAATEIEWAIQNARVVRQCLEMRAGIVSRDESMARNVQWILEQSPKAKIVLWAHNGHVAMKGLGYASMGAALRKTYGEQMVVLGFGFHQGSFQAMKMGSGLQDFTVPAAPAGTWDALMASAGMPMFALDLRQAPDELRMPMKTRMIGAVYSVESADQFWREANYPANYDALLFVESTTAARKNPASALFSKTADGEWLDTQTRVRLTLPEGWRMVGENRSGATETSIMLADGRSGPGRWTGLYYRVDRNAVPRTAEAVEKSLLSGMTAKQEQRAREGFADYRNQPESVRRHEVGGRPALSWTATYTVDGKAMVEACVYVQSDAMTALFFTKLPAADLAAFEEQVAPLVASLRIP